MTVSFYQLALQLYFPLNGLQREKLGCVMGLKKDLSGTRWEPGETALINNAAVSEGATQSPHTTGPFWDESKEDLKRRVSGGPVGLGF